MKRWLMIAAVMVSPVLLVAFTENALYREVFVWGGDTTDTDGGGHADAQGNIATSGNITATGTISGGVIGGTTVTANRFVGTGSTTNAVDLATAEVAGTLPAASVGNGLTDAQVSDTLTASIVKGSGSTTDAVDLATAEVSGTLPDANVSDTLTASVFKGSGSTTDAVDLATAEVAGTLADANVSDTLTASVFKGSGSTTDAVDLATAEVAGTLAASAVGTGLTDAQVSDTLTIASTSTMSAPPAIGAVTPAAGKFTTLESTSTLTVGADAALNGDDVTSTQATVNLWNATPTTINLGGNATALTIGKSGGTLTTPCNLAVNGGTISSTAATVTVFNGTSTTVNAFGNATAINIGKTGGTITMPGSLLVNGANIGITGNTNLLGLGAGFVTVNGYLSIPAVGGASNEISVSDPGAAVIGGIMNMSKASTTKCWRYGWRDSGGTLTDNLVFTYYNASTWAQPFTLVSGGASLFAADLTVQGGDLDLGTDGTVRGTLTLWEGSGGNTPGYLKMGSPNGTYSYWFINDAGEPKVHTSAPAATTDGSYPTAAKFKGSGSSTDAVDLGTAEVAGELADANVSNTLTIASTSTMSAPPAIGGTTPSTGKFTTLTATGVLSTTTVTTFTANDTTPTVAAGNVFIVPNTWTGGNNITSLDDGVAGQVIYIIGQDGDCVFVDGGNLALNSNWTANVDDTLQLVYSGSTWYELGRSEN